MGADDVVGLVSEFHSYLVQPGTSFHFAELAREAEQVVEVEGLLVR